MLYLFQITVYSALLYAVYLLALKDRATHNWNRLYLLLCASLPLVIPFIRIPGFAASIPVNANPIGFLLPEINVITKNTATAEHAYSLDYALLAIYVLFAVVFLSRSLIQYIAFKRFVQENKYEVVNNANVLLGTKTGPGSFLNYIFLPGDEIDPAIFEHELAHIRLKHSVDILFMRTLQALFWPNAMLYVILSELKIVHEFQADAYAVKNKRSYIHTLLNDTFGTNQFALAHTFFYHPLKRRIMMLQKSPLSRTKLYTALLKTGFSAIILLTGIVYLQSCNKQQPETNEVKNDMVLEFKTDPRASNIKVEPERTDLPKPKVLNTCIDPAKQIRFGGDNQTLNTADVMPSAGYDVAAFLSTNIKYPKDARKNGTQGRVFVKFMVNETGNIIEPVIIRSPDTALSTEALRVVKMMPSWKPGKQDGKAVAVYFYLPILFRLDNSKGSSLR